jgi:predicted CoA-binding protein
MGLKEKSGRGRTLHENPGDAELRSLLEGVRTVAVVGLSPRPERTSHGIARALQRFGLRIFPVNPTLTGPVLGEEPYPSVEAIPEPVDLVDVFRRPELTPPVAHDAVRAGARVLWLQTGVVNEEAAEHAASHGLAVVMDRCLMVEYARLVAGR